MAQGEGMKVETYVQQGRLGTAIPAPRFAALPASPFQQQQQQQGYVQQQGYGQPNEPQQQGYVQNEPIPVESEKMV